MKTISELAAEHSLTLRALRFWEQKGLISPDRHGSHRLYSEADCERIARIVAWTAAGLSLREVRLMLAQPESAATLIARRLPEIEAEARVRLAAIHRLQANAGAEAHG